MTDASTQPAVLPVSSAWHAPGLGEVHSTDHLREIYCQSAKNHDEQMAIDDELARRVCMALNAQEHAPGFDLWAKRCHPFLFDADRDEETDFAYLLALEAWQAATACHQELQTGDKPSPVAVGQTEQPYEEIVRLQQQVEALCMLRFELDGVIVDSLWGDGFDDLCLQTIKHVRTVLAQAARNAQPPHSKSEYKRRITVGDPSVAPATVRADGTFNSGTTAGPIPDEMFCLDTMNADHWRGYEYGCAEGFAALQRVLDGEDSGAGVSNEPWETLRWRIMGLMAGRTAPNGRCRKCGGEMMPGKAMGQTFGGKPDFIGGKEVVTVSPGGPGQLIDCLKCKACGRSVGA